MATVETSISINKPVETVFDFLTNLQNQKAWNSNITDVVFSGKVAVVVFPGRKTLWFRNSRRVLTKRSAQ